MDKSYDVVVVGGGAAGLSGALALGRSRRSVIVVDAGEPRNAPAAQVHNFLTRDGTPPHELYAFARAEVAGYGVEVVDDRVTRLSRESDGFCVEIGAVQVSARRLLLATGLRDELPQIPGLADRWGIDVLHCPYCHGYEVRDQRIGVLCTNEGAMHQAPLFRQLSDQVTVLQHTGPALTDDEREQLEAIGIAVLSGEVVAVEADHQGLTGVRLADGGVVDLDALVIAPAFAANTELAIPLGLMPDESALVSHLEADHSGTTAVAGVWIAGNVGDTLAQVVTAAAQGLAAGAAINADLVAEDMRRAVEARRALS